MIMRRLLTAAKPTPRRTPFQCRADGCRCRRGQIQEGSLQTKSADYKNAHASRFSSPGCLGSKKRAQAQETATRHAMNPRPRVRQICSVFCTKSATFFSDRMLPTRLDRPRLASHARPILSLSMTLTRDVTIPIGRTLPRTPVRMHPAKIQCLTQPVCRDSLSEQGWESCDTVVCFRPAQSRQVRGWPHTTRCATSVMAASAALPACC